MLNPPRAPAPALVISPLAMVFNIKRNTLCCALALATALTVSYGAPATPTPIVELRFDSPQEWQPRSRLLKPPAKVAASTGVSGRPGDYALDLSANAQMGDQAFQGHAIVYSGAKLFDNLDAFTVCGWFKASVAPVDYARIFNAGPISLWFHGRDPESTQFIFDIDGVRASVNEPLFRQSGEWIFFAISYDGTSSVGNVAFYAGTTDKEAFLVKQLTLNKGSLPELDATDRLAIGARAAGGRRGSGDFAFKGFIDNFRLFGSRNDSAAALSLDNLEQIRRADISGTPLP